ncbi:MAG: ribosome silencing factor [Desulfobacterales bacterium]
MTDDFTDAIETYLSAVMGKKAENLIVLDVRELTSVADAFIICSGRSNRQVQAIADHIQAELKKQHKKPLSVEGLSEGHWALLDYGDVIIHIFYEPVRLFYDLEGLWMDARRIKTDRLKRALPPMAATEKFDE